MIDRAAIAAARRSLATQPDFLRTTPLMRLSGRSLGVECAEVWLKLEHLQVGGSFKARGMLYRLLANPVPDSGVIIASGGNAGEAKRARLRALGAEVVVVGAAYSEALEACVARQQATGALQAHAYDQPEVVAGAGTLALEIEEQGGRPPDSMLVSVGGGGLIGGVAAWFASRAHVVALEPERAPTLHSARAAGQPVDVEVGGLAADAIRAAQLWLWKEFKLAVEPAAALGLAALQTGAYKPQPQETVALILCGANFDPASLV